MEMDELIIELIQNYSFIYDNYDIRFRDKGMKKEAFLNISALINKSLGTDTTGEDIERRWGSLRDMFTRAHRTRHSRCISGNFSYSRGEWPYYGAMSFLLPHLRSRSKRGARIQVSDFCAVAQTGVLNIAGQPVVVDVTGHTENGGMTKVEPDFFTARIPSPLECASPPESVISIPNTSPLREECYQGRNKDDTPDSNQNIFNPLLSDEYEIYAACIKERFKRVPDSSKTACLIEILKVISTFEQNGR